MGKFEIIDRKNSTNDKSYFNTVATNGQIIGPSQM